jgi:hypothetical protein
VNLLSCILNVIVALRYRDNIIMYWGIGVTYRRVSDWMVGFSYALYTRLVTIGNYSANAIPTHYRSLLHILASSAYYALH